MAMALRVSWIGWDSCTTGGCFPLPTQHHIHQVKYLTARIGKMDTIPNALPNRQEKTI
jgi:hypothetical protein